MKALSRAVLTAMIFATTAASSTFAHAAGTFTVSGRVTDPHGRGVADVNVYGLGINRTRVDTATDANGSFSLHLDRTAGDANGCWHVQGQPDDFYAVGLALGTATGNYCADTTLSIPASYRTRAVAPAGREYFSASTTAPVTTQFVVEAYSRTYPAIFDKDPLTYQVTDHPAASATTTVVAEDLFTSKTVDQISSPISHEPSYRYTYRVNVTIQPRGHAAMMHLDWGRSAGSVFANMMDCRMYWFGLGYAQGQSLRAAAGAKVTVNGAAFGTQVGRIDIGRRSGKSVPLSASEILEWTPTRIVFQIPADAMTAYTRIWTKTGTPARCIGGTGASLPRVLLTIDPTAVITLITGVETAK